MPAPGPSQHPNDVATQLASYFLELCGIEIAFQGFDHSNVAMDPPLSPGAAGLDKAITKTNTATLATPIGHLTPIHPQSTGPQDVSRSATSSRLCGMGFYQSNSTNTTPMV